MATLKNQSTQSQCDQILKAMKAGRRITALFGVKRFGSTRVGARIWDLREEGHKIKTRMVKNGRKRWAEYFMPRYCRTVSA